MARKLSAGALAARANGYGTLAKFREFSKTRDYAIMAGRWATATGTSYRSAFRPNSRFAKVWGKSFLKDGTLRSRSNKTYAKRIQRQLNLAFPPEGPEDPEN